jgi:hypothetical protein
MNADITYHILRLATAVFFLALAYAVYIAALAYAIRQESEVEYNEEMTKIREQELANLEREAEEDEEPWKSKE